MLHLSDFDYLVMCAAISVVCYPLYELVDTVRYWLSNELRKLISTLIKQWKEKRKAGEYADWLDSPEIKEAYLKSRRRRVIVLFSVASRIALWLLESVFWISIVVMVALIVWHYFSPWLIEAWQYMGHHSFS